MPATATTPAKKAHKRRRRKPQDGPVWYVVAIESWEWSLSFGIDRTRYASEPYTDFRHLHLFGKLVRPSRLQASDARIVLIPDASYNRCNWGQKPDLAVGGISLYRGAFEALCSIPADALAPLLTVLAGDRIKYVTFQGAKFRYGSARVDNFRFDTEMATDDLPPG
jgi:hypothetical protein